MIKFETKCDECIHHDTCKFIDDFNVESEKIHNLAVDVIKVNCQCKYFLNRKSSFYQPGIRQKGE